MSTFYVYEHWRLDRDECFYVGKGKAGRAYKMKGRNRHHMAIQAKLSREGFAIEVRIVKFGLSEPEAFELERERILFWKQAGADLANLTDGGEGPAGIRRSDEARARMSAARKGSIFSEAHLKKLSEAQINRGLKGENNPFFGKRHSEKTKDHLSKTRKGRSCSPEHRKNVSEAIREWWAKRKRIKENAPS